MSRKVGMISLGCPKNQVDAEIMLKKLVDAGYILVQEAEKADVVIVNTCGFIEDAKKESIDAILEMVDLKSDGLLSKIIVTGCLAQRYNDEVFTEIPEVDGVIGIGANDDIVAACDALFESEEPYSSFPDKEALPLTGGRILTTPEYTAYLKIAEGCSNRCSYCAIPSIRGDFRSREMEDILEEIVGEIWDERDEAIEDFIQLEENKYRVLCSANIEEFFEFFDLEPDEETESTTVNGWVIEIIGSIPEQGFSFEHENLFITVTKADELMAQEIEVEVKEQAEEETEEDE